MSEPKNLQFVDTNVLVYAHDLSAGAKHKRARELIGQLWQTQEGCLSIQVLQEFYVTVTHKVANPMSSEATARIVGDLSTWNIHCPGPEDVLDAIRLQTRYQLSFWDAMIVASAIQLRCKRIWSENLNARQNFDSVTVLNPFT